MLSVQLRATPPGAAGSLSDRDTDKLWQHIMNRGDYMARQKLKTRVFITVNGEPVPMLTIDEDGRVEYALPKEEIIKYDQLMLKNIARAESDYHSRLGGIT